MRRPINGGDAKIASSTSKGIKSFITVSQIFAQANVERAHDEERHHDADVN
jgi:hypothetical protein